MSVSVIQQPASYTPAYSPQYFTAFSNQTSNSDFAFIIYCTDVQSGEFVKFTASADVNSRCHFNAQNFAKTYIDRAGHTIPNNQYNFFKNAGIKKIRVNIGEYYGGAYHAGSDIDYIVWNGVLSYMEYPSYSSANYLYNDSTHKLLTHTADEFTYPDRSNFIYLLSYNNNDCKAFRIKTYDSSGGLLGTSEIANGYTGFSTYSDRYWSIDVGLKGLNGLTSGEVSGTYPIIPYNCSYYTVEDKNAGLTPGTYVYSIIKTYYIQQECNYTVNSIHFLAKSGAFETCHFAKRSDSEISRSQSTYKRTPFTYGSSATYSVTTPTEKALITESQESFTLNTDWLTDAQFELYKQMATTPLAYLDLGSSTNLVPVIPVIDSYQVKKKINDKLSQITMRFRYAHTNHYQTV